ncbi:hypothetical protein L596_007528 [Steinernema carpocapsae]|nr:hypothetical protein L596_007528 [Steinernema carpocapsae]
MNLMGTEFPSFISLVSMKGDENLGDEEIDQENVMNTSFPSFISLVSSDENVKKRDAKRDKKHPMSTEFPSFISLVSMDEDCGNLGKEEVDKNNNNPSFISLVSLDEEQCFKNNSLSTEFPSFISLVSMEDGAEHCDPQEGAKKNLLSTEFPSFISLVSMKGPDYEPTEELTEEFNGFATPRAPSHQSFLPPRIPRQVETFSHRDSGSSSLHDSEDLTSDSFTWEPLGASTPIGVTRAHFTMDSPNYFFTESIEYARSAYETPTSTGYWTDSPSSSEFFSYRRHWN